MSLEELRARLKEKGIELKNLQGTDTSGFTPEQRKEHFSKLKGLVDECNTIDDEISTYEAVEQRIASTAKPATQSVEERTVTVAAQPKELTTADKVGIMVFSMAEAHKVEGRSGPKATFEVMKNHGYEQVAGEFNAVHERAVNSGQANAGGVLLPSDMSDEVIDLLRPNTTFMQGNPRRVPLNNGAYKLPAAASGATASWRGEGRAIQASQPTFKDINLQAKLLDSLVPLTNQIQRWSLPDVRQWVQLDMSLQMGISLDLAAYFGAGTAHTPLGIANVSGIYSAAATGGTGPTVTQIESDARGAELSMEAANLPMVGMAWVMAPRTKKFLADLRDTNGNRYYPELRGPNPMWRDYPVLSSTQVGVTGGATTDESKILLVSFDGVLLGESRNITFGVSTEATYVNSDGATVSAFQNDLTLIKASLEADVGLRYLEAVAAITGVRWGG